MRKSFAETMKWNDILLKMMEQDGEGMKRFIFTYVQSEAETNVVFQQVLQSIHQNLMNENSLDQALLFQLVITQCKKHTELPFYKRFFKKNLSEKDEIRQVPFIKMEKEKEEMIRDINELSTQDRAMIILYLFYPFTIRDLSLIFKLEESSIQQHVMRIWNELSTSNKHDFHTLTKEDLYTFQGEAPFYTEVDFQTFIEQQQMERNSKKQTRTKVGIGVGLFVLFFIGVKFSLEEPEQVVNKRVDPIDKETTDEVDEAYQHTSDNIPSWSEAESEAELQAYYERMTPGFLWAKANDFITPIDKVYTLRNGSEFSLDYVWTNSHESIVYYHIDAPERNALQKDLIIYPVTNKDGVLQTIQHMEEGVIYKNQAYHAIRLIHADSEEDKIDREDNKVVVDMILYHFGHADEILDVEIPHDYRQNQQHETTILFDEQPHFHLYGQTLNIEKIDIGISENTLSGTISHWGDELQLQHMEGAFISNHQELAKFQFYEENNFQLNYKEEGNNSHFNYKEDSKIKLFFPPFPTASNAENYKLYIDYVIYSSPEKVAFEVDVSDYDEIIKSEELPYEKEVGEVVAGFFPTKLFLEKVVYSLKGVQVMLYSEDRDIGPLLMKDKLIPFVEEDSEEIYGDKDEYINGYTVNEQGIHPTLSQHAAFKDGERFGFDYSSLYITSSEKLYISLTNILYEMEVNNSITVPNPSFE